MKRLLAWKRLPRNVEEAQRGAALIWLSLMLTFLIGAAAFAVDLGWLYVNSSRIQRTADASALGGVTFMPSFPSTAQTTAVDIASANGYVDGTNATLSYPTPPEDYQFTVAVTSTVNTFLLRVFGQDTVTMTRQATAEYVLPVPIGSPLNQFGYSPLSGYWAAISAPYTDRDQGDYYATQCKDSSSQSSCVSSNSNYRSSGYWYAIDLPAASDGLTIQVYDAGFYERGSWSVGTGDREYGGIPGTGQVDMRFSLFAPDGTPLIHTDNPTASCNSGWANGSGVWNVDPEDSSPDTEDSWFTFCNINPGATTPGRYVMQVQSVGVGHATNQYAIRAYAGSGPDPAVQGINDISVFANITGGSSNFYMAEIDEVHAGKELELKIFDAGEGSGTNTITIFDPYGVVPSCSWESERPNGTIEYSGSGTCAIDASDAKHNENMLTITIDLGAGYTCNPGGSFGGCWWTATFAYQNQAHDRTVWEARIIGNPIHLVND